jgi:serine/threonine protein kinase/tetratricopeptide (TPR) repeat protein
MIPAPPDRLDPPGHALLEALRGCEGERDASFPDPQGILDDFTRQWGRGEIRSAADYLARLGAVERPLAVQLIYREYCLAELAGHHPDPAAFLDRFPEHRPLLERVFALHRIGPTSRLADLSGELVGDDPLPEVGHEIGPYVLRRELGRGSFARVFLAEQADLENRHVVVKVSTRPTREPWLLARARHANIVEILTHADVNDGAFQLISMPFLGGATLSAVLSHRRGLRRKRACRGHLLRDLDAVAAPEYAEVNATHPARELLARLTDAVALAWIAARLAEALDHAIRRDVAHGDVKPSNILLTAHGTPMLLDFNLAQDWSLRESTGAVADAGGTLAYMAPERLRAIASVSAPAGRPGPGPPLLGSADDSLAGGPHSADLYSLGVVLLEALTGDAPTIAGSCPSAGGAGGFRALAAAYAAARERGTEDVIRASEAASARPIHPGLRAILGRCLAARPSDRYRRGQELAEDLDRWRADLPLAYTPEPLWGNGIPRRIRSHRKALVAAAVVVTAGVLASSAASFKSQEVLHAEKQAQAKDRLGRLFKAVDSGLFRFRPGRPDLSDSHESPLETATRVLNEYKVFADADWRQGDDVRSLPAPDREELECCILEQALRYCRAIDTRPGSSPDDRLRAIRLLDRVDANPPLQALAASRHRLLVRLAEDGALRESSRGTSRASSPSPWLDHYVLGVAAELEGEAEAAASPGETIPATPPDVGHAVRPTAATSRGPFRPGHEGLRRAIEQYDRMLALRPDSFWGHYRAAAVCSRLERWAAAAGHLERCCTLRPENGTLHAQLASFLRRQGRLDAALRECDRALELAPDQAEFYRSRAFIRAGLGQIPALERDLEQFERLAGVLTRDPFAAALTRKEADTRAGVLPPSRRVADLGPGRGTWIHSPVPLISGDDPDRDDLDARINLADAIRQAGAFDFAARELDKILALDPDHIDARCTLMMQELEQRHFDAARDELDIVVGHADLFDFLHSNPENLKFFARSARQFALRGQIRDALRIADRLFSFSVERGESRGLAHYTEAAILGVSARTHAEHSQSAAAHLKFAFLANSRYAEWYRRDKIFDPVRNQIDALLDRIEDPESRF